MDTTYIASALFGAYCVSFVIQDKTNQIQFFEYFNIMNSCLHKALGIVD
jgi:hypothetical protein